MASAEQENLEVVLVDLFGALRRSDFDAAAALFDPDVTWQGLREEWVCDGREAVLEGFRWGLAERREIEALELTRGRDRVVLGVRGPGLAELVDDPLGDQIFNVFTLRDGRIVRIDDYPRREEALAAAGVTDAPVWR